MWSLSCLSKSHPGVLCFALIIKSCLINSVWFGLLHQRRIPNNWGSNTYQTVAKLQLGSNNENNFMAVSHRRMRNHFRVKATALDWLRTTGTEKASKPGIYDKDRPLLESLIWVSHHKESTMTTTKQGNTQLYPISGKIANLRLLPVSEDAPPQTEQLRISEPSTRADNHSSPAWVWFYCSF